MCTKCHNPVFKIGILSNFFFIVLLLFFCQVQIVINSFLHQISMFVHFQVSFMKMSMQDNYTLNRKKADEQWKRNNQQVIIHRKGSDK